MPKYKRSDIGRCVMEMRNADGTPRPTLNIQGLGNTGKLLHVFDCDSYERVDVIVDGIFDLSKKSGLDDADHKCIEIAVKQTKDALQADDTPRAVYAALHLGVQIQWMLAKNIDKIPFHPLSNLNDVLAYCRGEWVKVSEQERRMLDILNTESGDKKVQIDHFVRHVWNELYNVENRATYDNAITRLNKKLLKAGIPRFIHHKDGSVFLSSSQDF